MLAFSHALAGAAIAASAPHPTVGYFIAILSHPVLDLIPHWDFNTRNGHRTRPQTIAISLADACLGFGLGWLFFSHQVPLPTLAATMFLAQLPDWLESPYHIFYWRFPPFTWVKQFQHHLHWKLELPWGLYTQLTFLVVIVLLTR